MKATAEMFLARMQALPTLQVLCYPHEKVQSDENSNICSGRSLYDGCGRICTEGKRSSALYQKPLHLCKAEDFWQMSDSDRELYASGLVDGFLAIGFFDAPDEEVTWITSCVRGMDSKQVSAIIAKHIKDHPEWSNRSASGNAYLALVDACPMPNKSVVPKK